MIKYLAKLLLVSIIIFLIFAFPAYLVGKWKGVLMLFYKLNRILDSHWDATNHIVYRRLYYGRR